MSAVSAVERDTIVAMATAPGRGAVAIVRWSGPTAFEVLKRVCPDCELPLPRVAGVRRIVDPESGRAVDRGLVTRFEGPASFTGEDVVEFSGHGGRVVPGLVLEAVLRAGARLAEPGEFTRRAYLLGKIDLVQAEAVGDLIESRSVAQARVALQQVERGLSSRIDGVRSALVDVQAMLTHHLDFPEEDDAPVPIEGVAAAAGVVRQELARLLETAPLGERVRSGAVVVLAGPTNAGKSSLFNALVGEERALVTEVAGTTRDAIVAEVELDGFPMRLVDTAGLRETREFVEQKGIEVARSFVRSADLVLFCTAAGEGTPADGPRLWARAGVEAGAESEGAGGGSLRVLFVRTKSDVVQSRSSDDEGSGAEQVVVSSRTGEGLDALKRALRERLWNTAAEVFDDGPPLTRERHRMAVSQAEGAVRAFIIEIEAGVPADLASTHLHEAQQCLQDVLGVIPHDEVLEAVFARFCIGK